MDRRALLLWITLVPLAQSAPTLSPGERYEVVTPQRLSSRVRRSPSLSSPQYPDVIRYELTIEGRNRTVQLEKNRNLLGRDYTETHYLDDGRHVTTPASEDHCYYHGRVEGVKDSSVSVGICSGISGLIRAGRQVHLIEPLGRGEDGEHALYRQEQLLVSGSPRCESSAAYNQEQPLRPPGLFKSRSWRSNPVRQPPRFVELIVVADYAEYQRYGSRTQERILGAVNHIDKLYRTLNIRIMLVGLEIWTSKDRISVDPNSDTTLDRFLRWRQEDLLKRTQHDNAQFVTGIDFDGDTVGLANKFAMCTGNSGGINQDHHNNLIGLASTIAHEMGHNFGLSHDSPSCMCSSVNSGTCVMADKLRKGTQVFPESFSGCSEKQLAEFFERAQPSCLSRPSNAKTIGVGPRCGNAMLDPGEECDCGTVEECRNRCCDASTCRLVDGARCAHGDCCNETCQLKQAGSECRGTAGECDLAEYCSGLSENCPADSFVMNGKPCYNQGHGFCHDGRCPTHQHHCWRLFGQGTKVGSDSCFDLNKGAREEAHCGRSKYGYIRCTAPNVKCGSIFCEGSGDSITGKKAVFTLPSKRQCVVAMEEDKKRNLDMVPAGSVCGLNKVCLNNKCVNYSAYGEEQDCSKKCNNNGVCNHKRECHCGPGWAPPYCNAQYADLPRGHEVIIGVCAALAILLVLIFVPVGVMCYRANKRDTFPPSRKVHSTRGKMHPMFREQSAKGKPQISDPTLMETTATQACAPLLVSVGPGRPAPQLTPSAASKPLPPLNSKQIPAVAPVKSSHPPVPPVKPSSSPVPPIDLSPFPIKPSPSRVRPVKDSPSPLHPVKPSPPPVPSVKPSPPPVPSVKPSPPPVPSVKPSPPPVPSVKPSPPPVPQVKPSPPPVPQVKPSPPPVPSVKPSPPPVPKVKPPSFKSLNP